MPHRLPLQTIVFGWIKTACDALMALNWSRSGAGPPLLSAYAVAWLGTVGSIVGLMKRWRAEQTPGE